MSDSEYRIHYRDSMRVDVKIAPEVVRLSELRVVFAMAEKVGNPWDVVRVERKEQSGEWRSRVWPLPPKPIDVQSRLRTSSITSIPVWPDAR